MIKAFILTLFFGGVRSCRAALFAAGSGGTKASRCRRGGKRPRAGTAETRADGTSRSDAARELRSNRIGKADAETP